MSKNIYTAGLMASCLAHDFNNLLMAISGCAQLLASELPVTGTTGELAREMIAGCERAAGLTTQLRAVGRSVPVQSHVLDLNEIVRRTTRFLGLALRAGVALVSDLAADLPSVATDPGEMERVILNLVVNAKDAMPDGGRVTVATRALRLRAEEPASAGLPPGDYARLTVSDTGVGMTDEVKARAFEPFFTTKEAGKGTGLGLVGVRGIVERCGGRVDVTSAPGVGTTVTVLLPAATRNG